MKGKKKGAGGVLSQVNGGEFYGKSHNGEEERERFAKEKKKKKGTRPEQKGKKPGKVGQVKKKKKVKPTPEVHRIEKGKKVKGVKNVQRPLKGLLTKTTKKKKKKDYGKEPRGKKKDLGKGEPCGFSTEAEPRLFAIPRPGRYQRRNYPEAGGCETAEGEKGS